MTVCSHSPTCHLASVAASSRHGTRSDPPGDSRSFLDGGRRRVLTGEKANFVLARTAARPAQGPAERRQASKELDRLLAATLAEAKRRGRDTTPTDKRYPSRNTEAAVSLTRGQLNAVRAAFKAGITPARIARQFGLSQSGVRTALKSDKGE